MITIITTVELLVNILILAMIMKSTIKAREFFFNPVLQPVDFVTEPILKYFRRIFRPTVSGWDYTPLLAILSLILLQSLVVFSVQESHPLIALISSFLSNLEFFLQVMTICFIVALLVSPHVPNALARFLTSILTPFEKVFARFFRDRLARVIATYIGFVIVALIIWHTGNSAIHHLMNDPPARGGLLPKLNSRSHLDFMQTFLSGKAWLFSLIMLAIKIINSLKFISTILIISAVLSWLNLDPRNPVVQFVYAISEPVMTPIRRLVPSISGLDLSPFIGVLVIWIISRSAIQLLMTLMVNAVGI
jgi:YggT family protein